MIKRAGMILSCATWLLVTVTGLAQHGHGKPMTNRTVTSAPASLLTPDGKWVEYDLVVEEKIMSPAGKPVRVLTLNGELPGPVLRFKEGVWARIRVHNKLAKETTSIHWHGLLLPNAQDGVPGLTTPFIMPGTTHTFEFKLKHAGTYWYHSHTMLQEQIGVLGAIVVEPSAGEAQPADREHVLLLSDWTNEDPDEVMRTLKRGSDYYSLKKKAVPSLWGAYRAGRLRDYFHNQWVRMPPMDISDVGYDAFFVNGKESVRLEGNPGETIRLRVVNGSAATYFYLQSATGPMTIVAADGPPVEPVAVDRLLIAIAETYDVLITLPESGAYEVRATAQDGSGHATAIFGEGAANRPPEIPRPDIYDMDGMLMAALDEMDMGDDAHGDGMAAHGQAEGGDAMEMNARPLSPYRQLRSPVDTSLPADQETRTVTLRLTGDMERYIWSFNGKTLFEDPKIVVKRGENIRFEFINDSMMHHPIHLHGHFFRVLNGQGEYSPLKHTIDVPPMGKRVVEFDANESQDWMLHCHVLYHMMAGMTRIVSYAEQGADHQPDLSGEHKDPLFFWTDFSVQSHFSEGEIVAANERNNYTLDWMAGWQRTDGDVEYEGGFTYSRYYSPNFSAFAGGRVTNKHGAKDRAVAGIDYRLPLLVWTRTWVDSEGDFRVSLEKELQLTTHWAARLEVEYDTGTQWEGAASLSYTTAKRWSLLGGWHSDYGWGGGLMFRF
jgi:FtsP/CotA-like multicopper oxidase with cupredoxin domain